jgi:hypothetical protein
MNLDTNKRFVINIGFSSFLLSMLAMKYFNKLNSNLDYFLAFIAIISSIIVLTSENPKLIDLAHFSCCGVFIPLISLFSNNIYLLVLNIIYTAIIIGTRYFFSECLLNTKQDNKGYFVDLNSDIKEKLGIFWNWNYIFPFFLANSTKNLYNKIVNFKPDIDIVIPGNTIEKIDLKIPETPNNNNNNHV